MLFSSLTFLLFFLPMVLALYYIVPSKGRNALLLAASLLFYAWGEPVYIIAMAWVILMVYVGALVIDSLKKTNARQYVLIFTVSSILGTLAYFKYMGFILQNLPSFNGIDIPFVEIIMPIGISFYTFQAVSYIVDVYRGDVRVQKNPFKVALFISLFPQLVAGPIVKYHDVCEQLDRRSVCFDSFIKGVKRFIIGLGKKIIIANTLGEVVDKIFALRVDELSPQLAWVGAVFYAMQLYYDFSGYSDMAIGLGHMFGFKFLENFNYPYISKSVTEFWRRWHMSLSTWFKQYVYIPLGGNRSGKIKTLRNLAIVFFLTGLWHGAAWNFIVWGLYHGAFIILEKATGLFGRQMTVFSRALGHIYLLGVVVVGWVIFRAPDLTYAWQYIRMMFGLYQGQPAYTLTYYVTYWSGCIFAIAVLCSAGLFKGVLLNARQTTAVVVINVYLLGMFVFCLMNLVNVSYNPFIYFRF